MGSRVPLILLISFLGLVMAKGGEKPEFEITVPGGRKDNVSIQADKANSIVKVTSETGIGRATLKLTKGEWPEVLTFHLHLKGLEGFDITAGETRIDRFQSKVQAFDKHGKPFAGKYLMKEAGYYEVKVLRSAFPKEVREIQVQWIDFYR